MEYITTTNLRTQTSQLVNLLKKGMSMSLVHRSKIIGEIQPAQKVKPFDAKAFLKFVNSLNLPKTTYAQREKTYRKHLMEKYGKGLSC